jgi:NTP pyrophosphatase (non-canonical NTP hydrolase)
VIAVATIGELTDEIRAVNVEKGWRPAGGGPSGNTWGDYIALLHSEISEALEAYRDHRLVDATISVGAGVCYEVADMCATHHQHIDRCRQPQKPEGIGSEFADVLIRLLDMCDVFRIELERDFELADIAGMDEVDLLGLTTFGDLMAWMHRQISEFWLMSTLAPHMLRSLVTVARRFGVDLQREVERKIAYNRTRPFQHGGRTLAEDETHDLTPALAPARLATLREAMPTDPRDWWTGEEVDVFVGAWERAGLPELTLQDATGADLTLWTKDIERAGEMLGLPVWGNEPTIRMGKEMYTVYIVQAEEK